MSQAFKDEGGTGIVPALKHRTDRGDPLLKAKSITP
jgi:hypothetical protein